MLVVIIVVVALAAVAAIVLLKRKGGGSNPVTLPSAITLDASKWRIQYSPTMPPTPSPDPAGWCFDFPIGPDGAEAAKLPNVPSVHYVVLPCALNLAGKAALSGAARVEVTGDPTFQCHLQEDNQGGGSPASVRLYFQRVGDDMMGVEGSTEFFRWWSNPIHIELVGNAQLGFVVPLTPDQWSSVRGLSGNASPLATQMFNEALANIQAIGLTFGGGFFFGHGVNINQGTARFTLTDMEDL